MHGQMRRPQSSAGHEGHKRSEEHTSELQSQSNLVCRLLLEKKKKQQKYMDIMEAVRVRNTYHMVTLERTYVAPTAVLPARLGVAGAQRLYVNVRDTPV